MPAFTPCIGTRAQVDARPVRDGQMLVAIDTGEVFIDFNGVRVKVSGQSGGGETPHGDDDDDDSLLTGWAIVNAALLVSDSVQGGGPGAGILNTPSVLPPDIADILLTAYAVATASLLLSDSVSGGGPGDGVLNTPAVLLPDIDNELATAYSTTEGR